MLCKLIFSHLKSNMDRFIASLIEFFWIDFLYLKSNMDRFIDEWCKNDSRLS